MTIRDDVLAKQAAVAQAASQQGINLDDLRKESRGEQGVLAQLTRALNSATPTAGHERIIGDDFAGQVFNGTNDLYTISQRVLGQNILVWRVEQSTGTLIPFARGSNPAPSGSSFYFDGLFTVRVGTAPLALDGLLAVYIRSP